MSMLKTQFLNVKFGDATFADSNFLAAWQLKKPEIADTIVRALNTNAKGEIEGWGLLQALTQGSGRMASEKDYQKLSSNEYTWFLDSVHHKRAIPIAGPATPHGGINFQEFIVPMQERYYILGDVVVFADQTQARVNKEPYYQGGHWCYTLQIMGGDPQLRVAEWALREGQEVGMGYTAFEEGSEGGGMKSSTYMGFRNQMNVFRKSFSITGGAKTDRMVFKVPTKKGMQDLWLYKAQYDLMRQWNDEMEAGFWMSRYNKDVDGQLIHRGESGRPLTTGSGVEEQISGINDIHCSELTEEILQYLLMDVQQKAGLSENKHLMFFGGNGFIKSFHNAMKKALGTFNNFTTDGSYFMSKLSGNKLSFGYQFTTYEGLLGTKFTTVHHPFFDDRERWTATDPETGWTQKSFEGYLLDFSDYEGQPNIKMYCKGVDGEDRRMKQWYVAGSTKIDYGSESSGTLQGANGFDGGTFYMLSERMINIMNPLGCGRIILRKSDWR